MSASFRIFLVSSILLVMGCNSSDKPTVSKESDPKREFVSMPIDSGRVVVTGDLEKTISVNSANEDEVGCVPSLQDESIFLSWRKKVGPSLWGDDLNIVIPKETSLNSTIQINSQTTNKKLSIFTNFSADDGWWRIHNGDVAPSFCNVKLNRVQDVVEVSVKCELFDHYSGKENRRIKIEAQMACSTTSIDHYFKK